MSRKTDILTVYLIYLNSLGTIPQNPKPLISHFNNKEVFYELHETHRREKRRINR